MSRNCQRTAVRFAFSLAGQRIARAVSSRASRSYSRKRKTPDWIRVEGYESFASQVKQTKFALVDFLLNAAQQGKTVAGYGAPGKSATLLHYCGIGKDLIAYTVDRSPHKQGRFLPGSHIPIYHPDRIRETKPDYVVILPWNLKDEIIDQLHFIREWGGQFVVPIPKVTIC